MLSISFNSAYTYASQTASYRRQNTQKTFAESVSKQLTPPSVINIGELGFGADNLGRQYALNYAEDSTDENPIVIAKGNDEYGNYGIKYEKIKKMFDRGDFKKKPSDIQNNSKLYYTDDKTVINNELGEKLLNVLNNKENDTKRTDE